MSRVTFDDKEMTEFIVKDNYENILALESTSHKNGSKEIKYYCIDDNEIMRAVVI